MLPSFLKTLAQPGEKAMLSYASVFMTVNALPHPRLGEFTSARPVPMALPLAVFSCY
jgi:hypothetical protein